MSAESPRRVIRKGSAGHVVLPQPVNDPSLIDSVAGFIQEVVPQAYSGVGGDGREVITWARVQQADINDPALYPDTGEQDGVPPLLLVLGYGSGVQVWCVPASGEAREVLSWSQGSVRSLCILPSPEPRLPLKQDLFRHKRPLVAMVDNAGPGPHFCSVSFISIRDSDQVKSIKFSHQVWDVLANKRSVVVTLAERIAVFDAATLEDTLAVTTCYPSPDVNPVALGTRWLAYADRRLMSQWRSLGGCHSEGPQSVTATVFHAAKALGKGLRDLSETVASSLNVRGGSPETHSYSQTHTPEPCLKGIVTIVDVESKSSKDANEEEQQSGPNRILAHFNAHLEPIVALSFDPSGLLLVSADKRGHRFHVFRINPHPCGPNLTYVQHLYVLHRGDTTARIQDIAFSADSRWVAISSMRGTTHVFPVTPYGGPVGVRTHTTPHVVNKLSRFHRSAGLSDEGRNSPVLWDGPPPTPPLCQPTVQSAPTTVTALAQVRRQSALASPTEESVVRVAVSFGAPRAPPLGASRTRRATDSLFVMACSGSLVQYDLEPRPAAGVSKEKVCDDTSVELRVEARAEWVLQRPPFSSSLHPPLPCTNPLLCHPDPPTPTECQPDDEQWLSQVEIVTHAGPHRRLWMGPQFTFITVSPNNETGDTLDINKQDKQVVRSNPVNMPLKQPLIIESGSCSSLELSPNMVELVYKTDCSWSCRLREDLAEAMIECPSTRNTGVKGAVRREPVIERQVNPLGSVVTLTAQLNFPANPLTTDDGKVTVVGTETKKITLESRFNKPAMKSLLGECVLRENVLDTCITNLQPAKISDLDNASLGVIKSSSQFKQKSYDYEMKSATKVLAEVNDNIGNAQKKAEEKESVVETPEKRGKNGKARRKISKGEKNKVKVEVESKPSVEEVLAVEKDYLPVVEMNLALDEMILHMCEGTLQGSGDIEMQLREASSERDFDETLIPEPEDCKGRKRSLDITVETNTSNLTMEVITAKTDIHKSEELKENDKMSSRQRKKSRINDQEVWSGHPSPDDKNVDKKSATKSESKNDDFLPESVTVTKVDDKGKTRKKTKAKKPSNLSEYVCEDAPVSIDASLEMKKFEESDIETILLEVSQETLCAEPYQDFMEAELKNYGKESRPISPQEIESFDAFSKVSEEHTLEVTNEDSYLVEEKCNTTDDELKGFESDLLVKDSTWSPEKSPEKDTEMLLDDKDSDKESEKVKNYETTDKDSSDDCQPVVVKPDLKHAQKKGKSRKLMRKSREADNKVLEPDVKHDENVEKEDVEKLQTAVTKEIKERKDSLPKEAVKEKSSKADSEEEFVDAKKNQKEPQSEEDIFSDLRVSSDGVKRRIRKRETIEKEKSQDASLPELDVPKRSWSSIVAFTSEDPNGNIPKLEEPIAPVRSWSSIAAAPARSKSQEADTVKTNSVEDRDSVYESCNDSVGEEVEPAPDSLGSCYFDLEPKDETEDILVVDDNKGEASSESKNGSSVEDKSNTDSGEKEDVVTNTQTSNKKSKKQKKKKR